MTHSLAVTLFPLVPHSNSLLWVSVRLRPFELIFKVFLRCYRNDGDTIGTQTNRFTVLGTKYQGPNYTLFTAILECKKLTKYNCVGDQTWIPSDRSWISTGKKKPISVTSWMRKGTKTKVTSEKLKT